MKMLSLMSLLMISFTLSSQTWTAIYDYPIQDLVWDQPRVAVSADDKIVVGIETIRINRPLELTTDGGQNWTTLDADFQYKYAGFDGAGNLYAVSMKKNSGVSTNYTDSLHYMAAGQTTLQAIADLPNNGFNLALYHIDGDENLYTLSTNLSSNLKNQWLLYKNGVPGAEIETPFNAGSSSQRSMLKTSTGRYVVSTFNDGVKWSDDGQTWNDNQDSYLGNSTWLHLVEADNGDLFMGGAGFAQSTDGGNNWSGASQSINLVGFVEKAGNGMLFAISPFGGAWQSSDNGATWVEITALPASGADMYDFAVSDNFMYIAAKDSTLYRAALPAVSAVEEATRHTVRVYPNPSSHAVHLTLKQSPSSNWQVQLIGINGQLLHQAKVVGPTYTLADRLFPDSGMYLLSIQDGEGHTIQQTKIMKLK